MKRIGIASMILVLTLTAAGQGRPATQAEKAFASKTLSACSKAIPPGPAGWEASLKPDIAPPDTFSAAEGEPLSLKLSAAWHNPKVPQTEPSQSPANAQENALLAKQAELAGALAQATKKGDPAAEEKIQKELDDIEGQLDKIEASSEAKPSKPPTSTASKDSALNISIDVNAQVIPLPAGAKAASPVAGCKAYGLGEGGTLVLLGQWAEAKGEGNLRMEAARRPGAKALSVQTLSVRVEATPSRAKQVLEKIDWAGLKKLLAK